MPLESALQQAQRGKQPLFISKHIPFASRNWPLGVSITGVLFSGLITVRSYTPPICA